MKHCIDYPEIAYIVCSFVAERNPGSARGILDLMSKYGLEKMERGILVILNNARVIYLWRE